eukprot:223075-Rhodomonas_salina.1
MRTARACFYLAHALLCAQRLDRRKREADVGCGRRRRRGRGRSSGSEERWSSRKTSSSSSANSSTSDRSQALQDSATFPQRVFARFRVGGERRGRERRRRGRRNRGTRVQGEKESGREMTCWSESIAQTKQQQKKKKGKRGWLTRAGRWRAGEERDQAAAVRGAAARRHRAPQACSQGTPPSLPALLSGAQRPTTWRERKLELITRAGLTLQGGVQHKNEELKRAFERMEHIASKKRRETLSKERKAEENLQRVQVRPEGSMRREDAVL